MNEEVKVRKSELILGKLNSFSRSERDLETLKYSVVVKVRENW